MMPGREATAAEAKAAARKKPAEGAASYEKEVLPVLREYCFNCHGNGKKKGDVALDEYKDHAELLQDRRGWERVLENVRNHTMPPENKKQPTARERERVEKWIEREIFHFDCENPDPGRVTVRRLNRVEYNNTIRDLLGVDVQPADDFPADDSGYGFDNIGDALSMPPVLLEKYMAAAHRILDAAIVTEDPGKPRKKRFRAIELDGSAPGGPADGGARELAQNGDVFAPFNCQVGGEYVFRARAFAAQAGPEPVRMALRLDGKDMETFVVLATAARPTNCEVRVTLSPGRHRFAAAYLNDYNNANDPDPRNRDRDLFLHHLEVEGPLASGPVALPESHRRIFTHVPEPGREVEAARRIVADFARRAFRRPVTAGEVARLTGLFESAFTNKESFEISVSVALQAVLVSPHFLFRGEIQPEPDNPMSTHQINEFALASRLSYFLWSSMPDEELFALAEKGRLRRNLDAQVKRMLKDPKAEALVDNFVGQWLQLRNLKLVTPDPWVYPEFDDDLRVAMQRETELLFAAIMREDRSVLEFLNADYTFLNERLARHYGIGGVTGPEFRRVALTDRRRGGVLTHASFLTLTSNPTRTSPVKRGKWVLENILGTPPPPPPPDVPELDGNKTLTGTLRQRMEQHSQNAMCASCHQRMDPIGFAFEHYNGVGGWRRQDGTAAIESAGALTSGEGFKDALELKSLLASQKRDAFARCLTEKLLTYALGRGIEYYDRCAVDDITARLAKDRYRFSSLVLGVVKSVPFQMRRGEGDRFAQAGD